MGLLSASHFSSMATVEVSPFEQLETVDTPVLTEQKEENVFSPEIQEMIRGKQEALGVLLKEHLAASAQARQNPHAPIDARTFDHAFNNAVAELSKR